MIRLVKTDKKALHLLETSPVHLVDALADIEDADALHSFFFEQHTDCRT